MLWKSPMIEGRSWYLSAMLGASINLNQSDAFSTWQCARSFDSSFSRDLYERYIPALINQRPRRDSICARQFARASLLPRCGHFIDRGFLKCIHHQHVRTKTLLFSLNRFILFIVHSSHFILYYFFVFYTFHRNVLNLILSLFSQQCFFFIFFSFLNFYFLIATLKVLHSDTKFQIKRQTESDTSKNLHLEPDQKSLKMFSLFTFGSTRFRVYGNAVKQKWLDWRGVTKLSDLDTTKSFPTGKYRVQKKKEEIVKKEGWTKTKKKVNK